MGDESECPDDGEVWRAPGLYNTVWTWGNGGRWERDGSFVGTDGRTREQLNAAGWRRLRACGGGCGALINGSRCEKCLADDVRRNRDDRIRAEARREALRDAVEAVRTELGGVTLVGSKGALPWMKAAFDLVQERATKAIEALMAKEGDRG